MFNQMHANDDKQAEESLKILMQFFGDTDEKQLCSHELEEELELEFSELRFLIDDYIEITDRP